MRRRALEPGHGPSMYSHFENEMPLNPAGKTDRVGLKRMAEDHLHPHNLD